MGLFIECPTVKSERKVAQSCPTLATPWTVAYQAPQSTEFSRQEHWSGLSFPSPGDLPNPGIEPSSPSFQADALTSEPPGLEPFKEAFQFLVFDCPLLHLNQ